MRKVRGGKNIRIYFPLPDTNIWIENVYNYQTAESLINPKYVKGLEYSIYEVLEYKADISKLKEKFIKTHYKE
jgi:hypothetical protein